MPYLVDAANQNFLVNKDPTYKRSGSDAEVCLIQGKEFAEVTRPSQ